MPVTVKDIGSFATVGHSDKKYTSTYQSVVTVNQIQDIEESDKNL